MPAQTYMLAYLMVRDVKELYPEFGRLDESVNMSFAHMRWKLPLRSETKLVPDWKGRDHPTLITNKTYDWWSRTRDTMSHPTPGKVLNQMISAQLVLYGYAGVHCAAVEKDGKAVVLIAGSDTGKTTTSWNLTQKHGFRFICEDIGVTDGREIFRCPYTSTGLPRGVQGPRGPGISQRIVRKFINSGFKASVMSLLDSSQVCKQAPVSTMVFLRRGEGGVVELGTEDALALLYRLNRLEFRYLADKVLLNSWNNCGEPDLDLVGQREKDILNSLVEGVENSFLIMASDPDDFAEQVNHLI